MFKGKNHRVKRSKQDLLIDIIIYTVMILVVVVTVYPFYYITIHAFNDGMDSLRGGVYFFPRKFTLENFSNLLAQSGWTRSILISVARTVIGTVLGLLATSVVAYAISFEHVLFRNTYYRLFIFTMYFSGGMIPFYILLKNIGMLNTFWVYVIPGMFNVYYMLIIVNFYQSIPRSLYESAWLDGASDLKVFFKIALPLSKACLATIALYFLVSQWNAWMDSVYYVTNDKLRPMMYLMMQIINKSMASSEMSGQSLSQAANAMRSTTTSLQRAAMVLAVAPILCVYPFLQKYFVKGVMVGSVKE